MTKATPPCGPGSGCGSVNTFSTKEAEADLKRYRGHGVEGATRALVEAIKAEGVEGASLLDVGGGIGAIQLELLAGGLARSESVDATEAYVEVARREAERRGYADRASHRLGTLADLGADVSPADIVTLDKVICCDPNVAQLLDDVTERARRMIGLIYPRVTWWNRIGAALLAAWATVTRDPLRWHLHSEGEVETLLSRAGFERRDIDRTLIWHVALYIRPRPIEEGPPA